MANPQAEFCRMHRPVFFQKLLRPGIEIFGGVYRIQYFPVAIDEVFRIHFWNKIDGEIRVVPSRRFYESALCLEAVVELRAVRCIE